MKKYLIGILPLVGLLVACEPTPPPESEVRAKLIGEYCDESQTYRLQVKDDSTYFNRKSEPGIPSTRSRVYESCDGNYELKLEENIWKLHFLPDERPRNSLFKDCERTVDVWTPEDGYLIGENTVHLPDLFEGTALTKGLCDE